MTDNNSSWLDLVPEEHRDLAQQLIAPLPYLWVANRSFAPDRRDDAEAWQNKCRRSWPKKYGNDPDHWRVWELPDGTIQVQHWERLGRFDLVAQAERVARLAHCYQTDQSGHPYVEHPRRVAERLAAAGESESMVAAGWLHDTLEDTWVTPWYIIASAHHTTLVTAVYDPVVKLVEAVTKKPDESLEGYAVRIVARGATAIKRAELADNTDPERLALLDPAAQHRLEAKYAKFTALLDATVARQDTWEFVADVARVHGFPPELYADPEKALYASGDTDDDYTPATAVGWILFDNDPLYSP